MLHLPEMFRKITEHLQTLRFTIQTLLSFSDLAQTLASLEQKTAELKQAQEVAEVANRGKSEFLASISHDLRTPLNAILGYTYILEQDRGASLEQQQEWIHIIRESAQHLSMLIDDIVDLFKIEVRRLSIFPSTVQLPPLLTKIYEISQDRAVEKNIDLVYQPSPQLPTSIEIDPKRLQQVLLNLLDNAVKFTLEGTVYFRVTAKKLSQSAAVIRFEVEDTGVGIPPDKLATIFEPFEYGYQPSVQQGAGLGLVICQKLVQLMGGEGVKVESIPGKGSIFWFELPVTVIVEEDEAAISPSRNSVGDTGERKKILVVDDERHDRAILLKILAPQGFEMFEAADGITGVILALEQEPDLIFMDIVMPGFDGVEAIRAMRLAGANTPIIVLSGSALEQDHERSRLAGADDFLSKPIDPAELQALFEKYLKIKVGWNYAAVKEHPKEAVPLKIPPRDVLVVLQRLAIIGDMRALINNAEELSRSGYSECTQSLRNLAAQMKDAEVLRLIEDWLGNDDLEQ